MEVDEVPPGHGPDFNTEGYDRIEDNPFVRVQAHDSSSAVSTFSVDVDTASYANVRRFLDTEGRLPPKDAIRIEELLNYFPYDYPAPPADAPHPFAAGVDIAVCPWEPSHQLVRIALKGKTFPEAERAAANLVFLLDVSGSMDQPNKLPLLKQALKLLVDRLEAEDRVAIVVYAGAAGLVLPSTAGQEKAAILAALDRLSAGGSTNGGAGIELAYRIAAENFVDGGVNRVILATDGDFNVGVSDRGSLTRLVEAKAKSGVFLTVLGFGTGNVKDGQMEDLSNRGNGNYAYVDSLREARKVLVEEGLGTLVTIAKDVKIQIFFNPAKVAGWRLIGYENRVLRREDFDDDTKDAGEIGAGHSVTALYELVPVGGDVPAPATEENPFVAPAAPAPDAASKGPLFLRLRYKQPDGEKSTRIRADAPGTGEPQRFEDMDADFQWAAAVAGFGMLLRDSPHKGQCSWALVDEIASAARGEDTGGYRAEFLQLVRLATALSTR
jgi:Ca-activated chloride channel family protein